MYVSMYTCTVCKYASVVVMYTYCISCLCFMVALTCALGPGFVANLSDSVNRDFVLEDGGAFLLPRAFFPCNGEVKSVNLSLQFQDREFYSTSMTMKLSLWRSNGSDFVQVDDPHVVVYERLSNHVLSSGRAVYYSSTTEDVTVPAITMPFRVTAGDIVGIHLPPMLPSSFVHESVPLAWQTSPSSPVLLLTSRNYCWVLDGRRICYSLGRNAKPFILGEYIPGTGVFMCMFKRVSLTSISFCSGYNRQTINISHINHHPNTSCQPGAWFWCYNCSGVPLCHHSSSPCAGCCCCCCYHFQTENVEVRKIYCISVYKSRLVYTVLP